MIFISRTSYRFIMIYSYWEKTDFLNTEGCLNDLSNIMRKLEFAYAQLIRVFVLLLG